MHLLSVQNPPTLENSAVQKGVEFPAYPEKQYNLFRQKEYFDGYSALVK